MNPLVTFGDPEAVTRSRLVAGFAARADVFKPATVTNAFPTSTLSGDATHLQVELDGSGVEDYPVTERATVRVTAYSAPSSQTNAKGLASLALGLLVTYEGDALVYGYQPLTGRIKAVDPTTRNNMVSFTVRANMRAIPA